VDVDALCDGRDVVIGGIMEHIEEAGIHSGDSACSLPAHSLPKAVLDDIRKQIDLLARALKVVGLMNTQFAVQDGKVYLLEVNPRASRTAPFVSKATGRPLAKIAARCMVGRSLREQGITGEVRPGYFSVKESVFPFGKFPGVDPLLGPEMRSTGEVMGIGAHFGEAFAKALAGAGMTIPAGGAAFVSVRDGDKARAADLARLLTGKGFRIVATRGTASAIMAAGIPCEAINKVKNGGIQFIANTTEGKRSIEESRSIRAAAIQHKVCYFTTMAGAQAAAIAMDHLDKVQVNRLQELHEALA
jgi:carbamoyl-phosphate synthase large subunit